MVAFPMANDRQIKFVLSGHVDGVAISPRTISLKLFNEYNRQVADFISGKDQISLDDVQVTIEEGSYAIRATLGLSLFQSLLPDIQLLNKSSSLEAMDAKRAAIVASWQARAKSDQSISEYRIESHDETISIKVNKLTDYHLASNDVLIDVEKYVLGEVVDMGGSTKANVHLDLGAGLKTMIIAASHDYLRDRDKNLLYRKVIAHIKAKQNKATGELSAERLIGLTEYNPKKSVETLSIHLGSKKSRWAEIPDHVAWVRKLRE